MSELTAELLAPRWQGSGAGSRVRVLTTTRAGGLGASPFATLNLGNLEADDPATVAANRRRLQVGAGLPDEPRWLRQVHGTQVVRHTTEPPAGPPEADAAWTDCPEVVCAVLTADCLPVVIAEQAGQAIAVAHAGWRGLAGGVLEATIDALPVPAARCQAWLGPAIGPRAFEIGPEVRERLLAADSGAAAAFRPGNGNRWLADLYALARRRLRAAGVTRIAGGGRCTFSERDRFFSHRRDGPLTGRMATVAWLEREPRMDTDAHK